MSISILHKESQWIAINKPAGVSTHNAEDLSIVAQFPNYTPIHRLDKETSGLLILAKDKHSIAQLQKALLEGTKNYIAVCRKPIENDKGVWQFPLSDRAQGYKNPQGPKREQLPCLSEWWVVARNQYVSQLRVTIKTGRTHQIRRHALLAGHHVLGDQRYGDKKYNLLIEERYDTKRMFLHAEELSFTFDGKQYDLKADLPKVFDVFKL